METQPLHRWDVTPQEAIQIQQRLRQQVVPFHDFSEIRTIAGIDISTRNETARAAVVVLSFPDLRCMDQATASLPLTFPYVPGLLSFRESPAILKAFGRLQVRPDLLMIDGQGMAHPRRFGIACHLGLLLDIPSIGCAKSLLCGAFKEPGPTAPGFSDLIDHGEIIGAVLRTKNNTHPLFISIGHRIDLKRSIEYTLRCCRGYRLPEPTRLAHQAAGGLHS
ncbi:MAG: deoxyribonuclease V [Deltaproteobacteria bacterium]|nr:deoxyribonuclease V [Deltaproteobacteria bacterium]